MITVSSKLNRYVIPDLPSADDLLPFLRQIDEHRWYSNFGPLVTQFEHRLESHLSSPEAARSGKLALTSMMSCYHGLQIALQLLHLPQNAKVLVPSVTFPACPLAVAHIGAETVLADIDPSSWQLTPDTARRVAASMDIRAVMPVAVYGVPVDADAWDTFSVDTGIPVLIDAAAALETQPIPKSGLVAHSMHATKPFAIGEGGVLISRNQEWINKARCLSNFGTQNRITIAKGMNAKLSEYAGAVALAQLERWPAIKQKRRDTFLHYKKALHKAGLDLDLQQGIEKSIVSTLMLMTKNRSGAEVAQKLNHQGILAHRMYLPPLYHHPEFTNLTVVSREGQASTMADDLEAKKKLMPHSETLHDGAFGLPFHTFLDEGNIQHVVQALTQSMG